MKPLNEWSTSKSEIASKFKYITRTASSDYIYIYIYIVSWMPHGTGISSYTFTINTSQSLYQAVLFAPFPRNQASLSENVVAPKESPLHCVLWFSLSSCQAATVLVGPGWRGWFNSMLSESKLISTTQKRFEVSPSTMLFLVFFRCCTEPILLENCNAM